MSGLVDNDVQTFSSATGNSEEIPEMAFGSFEKVCIFVLALDQQQSSAEESR